MPNGEETKREVVILGVKGSGKTVFLSVLGHAFEKIGEFGLNLRPDPKTKRFVFETWNLMAPDDGSPQEFPPATDPNSDPLPLTWNVQVGTAPVFRLSSLDCAGETMVRAFTESGDAAREQMFSDALDRVFAAMDRGVPAPDAPGAMAEADPVTRLRTMTRRASVVCLFLNPRDFESQIAALPVRFRERLERRLAELRASAPPDLPARLEEERERSRAAEDRARKGLRDRHLAMLELLSTFLENPEFGRKRIVFVLTQTGEPDLRRALLERGGPWGFLRENVRELEAYDLGGRADALAVSSVDDVTMERNAAGDEIPRPSGPISSSGLLDFLLVAGGSCSQELAGLARARAACRLAEAAVAEAVLGGLPHEERFRAAQSWNDSAAAWRREAESFLAGRTGLSPAVRRRTLEFADADVRRARRRYAAEAEIRRILFEDVAAGRPATSAADVTGLANAVVGAGGDPPFPAEELGLGEAWWDEAVHARTAEFGELQHRFDGEIADLDWMSAAATLERMRLPEGGPEHERRVAAVATAHRDRAVRDGREALGRGDRPAAERALADLGEAERDAGPAEERPELEEGLEKLVVRQDALLVLESARGTFEGMDNSSASMRATAAAVRGILAKGLPPLEAAEEKFGREPFDDVHAGFDGAAAQAARLDRAVSARRRNHLLVVLVLLAILAAGWVSARLARRDEMQAIRADAISLSRRADFKGARARLADMPDWPFLLLRREDFAPASLPQRWSDCEALGEAKAGAEAARRRLEAAEAALKARFGADDARLSALSGQGWLRYRNAFKAAADALPRIAFDSYGLPPEDERIEPAVAAYGRAESLFRSAELAFAPASNLIESSASAFRLARDESTRRVAAFEERLGRLGAEGARRSIPAESLRSSPEWRACSEAFARATNALPRVRTDPFGLPVSTEPPSDLTHRYREVLSRDLPVAEGTLATLEATLSRTFASHDAAAAFRSVRDRFPAAVDLSGWGQAAQAVSGSRLDAVLDAPDVEAAWTDLIRTAGPSAARPPSREGWVRAGELLGQLLGNDQTASDDEKRFASERRPVCDAAARVYAEIDRRQSFDRFAGSANGLFAAGDWPAAARDAVEAGKAARLADERKRAEGILEKVRSGALADLRQKYIGKALSPAALSAIGIGSPVLRKAVGDELSALLGARWPEKAPETLVSALDWAQFRADLDLLSAAAKESGGTVPTGLRNAFEERIRAWNEQWIRQAGASGASAAGESRPDRAWTDCERVAVLLGNVRRNPFGPVSDLKRAGEIEAALPYLLRVSATKGGEPVDVKAVTGGKALRIRDGVPSAKTGRRTSILSYEKAGLVPCNVSIDGTPSSNEFLHFKNRGTNELVVSF